MHFENMKRNKIHRINSGAQRIPTTPNSELFNNENNAVKNNAINDIFYEVVTAGNDAPVDDDDDILNDMDEMAVTAGNDIDSSSHIEMGQVVEGDATDAEPNQMTKGAFTDTEGTGDLEIDDDEFVVTGDDEEDESPSVRIETQRLAIDIDDEFVIIDDDVETPYNNDEDDDEVLQGINDMVMTPK